MNSATIRQKFLDFYQQKGHVHIPHAPLVLPEDPSTLFTSSGMQPLVPYLKGDHPHPEGKRLVNTQPSFRAEDIEEVGDNRHTTFFEMLGNWSLGDYFKEQQLAWVYEFLTQQLQLDPNKLYVSVFNSYQQIPKDKESYQIWKKLGVADDHIFFYGPEKNWWSRSGSPDQMVIGDIGGPDSEVFYDFGTPHDPKYGLQCHPNCNCGRFLEIGNSVFIQYQKQPDGELQELTQKNVDFGGGLERLTAASQNTPDIFQIDLFSKIIAKITEVTGSSYTQNDQQPAIRIIADHLKAAAFLIKHGVEPSNKLHGYILRRLIRRSVVKLYQLTREISQTQAAIAICQSVLETYQGLYDVDPAQDQPLISSVLSEEINKFTKALERGLKEIDKYPQIDGKIAFDLYQSYGLPLDILSEILEAKGQKVNKEQFAKEFAKHQQLSRTASAGVFKGGLVSQGEQETKYHTATHLLNQSLRKLLGDHVIQQGSNITSERLRFDFSHPQKLTPDQLNRISELVNQKIAEGLPVWSLELDKDQALASGAIAAFNERYPEKVTVYCIGGEPGNLDSDGIFSKEICGGPHVTRTDQLGQFKIVKEESAGAGIRRIYAVLI